LPGLDSEAVFSIIGRIYDAALEARLWPEVVADIARLQCSDKALLFTPAHVPDDGGFSFPVGISESAMQRWASHYVQEDVWFQAIASRGFLAEGNVVTDDEIVPHEELLRSVWYREFLSGIGIARLCSGIVFGGEAKAALPTALSIFRDVGDPAFGDRERNHSRVLVPHLSRALGIMYRLRDAELKVAATHAALDRLASGVLLFGPQRAVLFANRAARNALAEEDGLRLKVTPQGRTLLSATSVDAQNALDAALDLCLEPDTVEVPHFSEVVRVVRGSNRAPYALNVSALPSENEFGNGAERPLAIAFLNDPDEPLAIDGQLLRRLYALTPAECRLAAQLCRGGSAVEIAARLGVRENTVKTQLKSLYAKTRTHRQAQLVKLLHSLHSTSR